MTNARRDGLTLVLLGSAIFVFLGAALEHMSPFAMMDFKVVYYSARCLAQHCDPYNESELVRSYKAEGGENPTDSPKVLSTVRIYVYQPNAFAITVPLALLPYSIAHIVWIALTLGSLVLASYLAWDLGADYAPILSGCLVFLILANSELLAIVGNAAGIVVSLSVASAWCFLRQRHAIAGVICLGVALALKPQDSGFVWLSFLLAGGLHRKRAMQALGVACALSLPAVLWVWHVAPHWLAELRTNLAAVSARGANIDPGPTSSGAHGLGSVTDLQAAISLIRDDPRFYNPASYILSACLLVPWLIKSVRSPKSRAGAGLALAAIAPLTMLPFYHRQYDAKLLLLAVPACAMVFAERRAVRWLALGATSIAIVLNGDFFWAILLNVITGVQLPPTPFWIRTLIAVQALPAPLALLLMTVVWVWIYCRRPLGDSSAG